MSLLIHGQLFEVPGLTTIPPASHGGPLWARLYNGDFQQRTTTWIRQIILHTTKGIYPQPVKFGSGPGGSDRVVADFWREDKAHSAAQIVVDTDGSVVCLCDLGRIAAWHAEASSPWSIGVEMYQLQDGNVYVATLDAAVTLVRALCRMLGIPEQFPRSPYRNAPLRRMETGSGKTRHQLGGPGLCGVFGHRDNTERRGRGDPGDSIWRRLAAVGFEGLDFEGGEDIMFGKDRQLALNARGERLTVDGIAGPRSMQAMVRQGFSRWRDVA